MSHTDDILESVRQKAAPPDEHLKTARYRRDEILNAAESFTGVARTYLSGSVAHGTANEVRDADCGVVLDRRTYGELGPDGDNVGPKAIVEDVREHLKESGLKDLWPGIRFHVLDRSIKVFFNEPMWDETDPTVDLIVALERLDAPGLWIPKAMTTRPAWDASDPERHTKLFLPSDPAVRRTRVRVTRLAKLVNDEYSDGYKMSSFNIASLVYWSGLAAGPLDKALLEFYTFAAEDMRNHATRDPAEVSDSIRLPKKLTRAKAADRFESQRDAVAAAIAAPTKDEAAVALAALFPEGMIDASDPDGKRAIIAAARQGLRPKSTAGGLVAGTSTVGRVVKSTRSFGGDGQ